MTPVYVNGRFLTRSTTGVERFALMILRALDALLDANSRFTLLAPRGAAPPAAFRNIGFREIGRTRGHVWEQTELAWASRDGALVNLCNSGPVAHPRSLTVLHDAWVYRHPHHFARGYRLFHQRLGRLLARRSRIATVSHFSQGELADVLAIPPGDIAVIPNAADHMDAIEPDGDAIARLGLAGHPYLLLVGSFAPNKNMPAAIAAFEAVARPHERLVIVGAVVNSFANDDLSQVSPKILLAGRVDDRTLRALYGGARALVFPSLYEGFGIPPLEAMRVGAPVIASRIGPVEEVCGDAAAYFDPADRVAIGAAMRLMFDDAALRETLRARAITRRGRFSWAASSEILHRSISLL